MWGVFNQGGETLSAAHNWWGDAEGPGGMGPGEGDEVGENILFVPWLSDDYARTKEIDDTATGSGLVTFTSSEGAIGQLASLGEYELPSDAQLDLPMLEFPHGFFSFNIEGLAEGGALTVSISLPESAPAETAFWIYHEDGWRQIPTTSESTDDSVILIDLVDGGLGDADLTADGIITALGGPGYSRTTDLGTPHHWYAERGVEDDFDEFDTTTHECGFTGRELYIMGVDDLFDPDDRFENLSLVSIDGITYVTVPHTKTDRRYYIRATRNMIHPDWEEQMNMAGSGGALIYGVNSDNDSGAWFYKGEVGLDD